jgi:hypothetical protein
MFPLAFIIPEVGVITSSISIILPIVVVDDEVLLVKLFNLLVTPGVV